MNRDGIHVRRRTRRRAPAHSRGGNRSMHMYNSFFVELRVKLKSEITR